MNEGLPPSFFYSLAAAMGAVLGSFANCCIARIPKGISIVRPASHCPGCGHRLSWWENIPLLSFAILMGRCRGCREGISLRYPAVELICIILSLLTWQRFGSPPAYLAHFCLLVIPLVIVSFIDLDTKTIPDVITLPGIFAGIAVRASFAPAGGHAAALLDSIAGAFAGSLFLYLVAAGYERLKNQQGLGGGDIKLIAMLGAFFGWRAALLILFISSILGSIVGLALVVAMRKDMKFAIPFGPFLALAGLIHLFVGDRLISWYLGLL